MKERNAMNRALLNKSAINLAVTVAWLSETVVYQFDGRRLVSVIIFFISMSFICIEKKNGIRFVGILLSEIIIAICSFDSFFYAAPASLTFLAYKEEEANIGKNNKITKKSNKKESSTGIYLTLAGLLMFAGALYTFVSFSAERTEYKSSFLKIGDEYSVLFVMMTVLLISAIVKERKKNTSVSKVFKSIYIFCLIGITESTVIFILNENCDIVSSRFALVFWFMSLLFMTANINTGDFTKRIK